MKQSVFKSSSNKSKIIYQGLSSGLPRLPGPFLNRFTNLPLKVHVLLGRRCLYIHSLHQKYGNIVLIGPSDIAVSDLPSVRQIHAIGSGYVKSAWYSSFTDEPVPGIFAMIDPKLHARRRKLFSQAFSKNGLESWEDLVQSRTSEVVACIRREAQVKGSVDVLKWFGFMATDVITEFGFGQGVGNIARGEVTRLSLTIIISYSISIRARCGECSI